MRVPIREARILVTCATALWLLPAAAGAQHAQGVVEDTDGRPINEVYVTLLDESQKLVAAALSSDDGSFRIAAPSSGAYYLRLARIGYLTLFDGPYRVTRRDPLEARVVMHTLPVRMDPLEVSVSSRVERLAAVGFYERKEAGFGHFLEREEILRTAPMHLTDVLRRLPRMYVIEPPPGQLNPGLLVRGGAEGYCPPTVYLDGVVAAQGGGGGGPPVYPDDWLIPEDVEAVELYTGPASVPVRFGALAECGVLMIWTRHQPRGR